MVPLMTAIAVDIDVIWVQWLLTSTVEFPLLVGWTECLGYRVIVGSSEVSRCGVHRLQFIILFDGVNLALGTD